MSLSQALQQAEDEIDALMEWINRQNPRTGYEVVCCPMCWEPTEDRYMQATKPHKDNCPWRIDTRSPQGPQIKKQPN